MWLGEALHRTGRSSCRSAAVADRSARIVSKRPAWISRRMAHRSGLRATVIARSPGTSNGSAIYRIRCATVGPSEWTLVSRSHPTTNESGRSLRIMTLPTRTSRGRAPGHAVGYSPASCDDCWRAGRACRRPRTVPPGRHGAVLSRSGELCVVPAAQTFVAEEVHRRHGMDARFAEGGAERTWCAVAAVSQRRPTRYMTLEKHEI